MWKANITNIQHFNVHDGPGIRTVIFYQGCPLRCKWCQNPEAISMDPRMMFNQKLCIGCMACSAACQEEALVFREGAFRYEPEKCRFCLDCEKACYTKARIMSSHEMTIDEVYDEVMKDEVVYRRSGGGITISGGEPLLAIDFNVELFRRLKEAGIGTAVETAGYVPRRYFEQIAKYVDTFLFDFKIADCEKHKKWIGVDNTRIKENLTYICGIHPNVVVRIPLIPMVNDTDEEFGKIIEFVRRLRHVNGIHILPFHNLGAEKYSLLGDDYELMNLPEDNEERINACRKYGEGCGIRVNIGGTGFVDDKKNLKKKG